MPLFFSVLDMVDTAVRANPALGGKCRAAARYLVLKKLSLLRLFSILLSSAFASLTFAPQAVAQGIILNELSNGQSGAQEFFELVVVGSAASPTAPVNLDGWIIDDNNGEWGGSGAGLGIAPGHLRINATAPACLALAAVTPGTIILVYNGSDPDPSITGEDTTDSNGDGVYILNGEGACVTTYVGAPTISSTAYTPSTASATPNFGVVAMANTGDAGQVRQPNGALYHGFAYGNVPASPTPAGSFNVSTATGTASAYRFSCGSWNSQANFARISAATDTPGAVNNAQNALFRSRVSAGLFDYTNLANPANCSAIIVADPDSASGINGSAGAANILSVLDGDTLNGGAATTGTVTITVTTPATPASPGAPVPTLNPATGQISVPAATPAGTYTITYQICETLNPPNCATNIATITVAPSADLSIRKTNTAGINGDVDQSNDTVTTGTATTYTLTVTNNGPDSITGAVVTDTPGSGLTCPATNSVTISGSGIPAGSFTIADLTGPGITLATLANGQSATLTFICQVL